MFVLICITNVRFHQYRYLILRYLILTLIWFNLLFILCPFLSMQQFYIFLVARIRKRWREGIEINLHWWKQTKWEASIILNYFVIIYYCIFIIAGSKVILAKWQPMTSKCTNGTMQSRVVRHTIYKLYHHRRHLWEHLQLRDAWGTRTFEKYLLLICTCMNFSRFKHIKLSRTDATNFQDKILLSLACVRLSRY